MPNALASAVVPVVDIINEPTGERSRAVGSPYPESEFYPATEFRLGSEKRVVRFRVSDCQPLWVAPVNTEGCHLELRYIYISGIDV